MKRDFIFVVALIFLQGYTTVPEFWEARPANSATETAIVTSTPEFASTPDISPTVTLLAPLPTPTSIATPTATPILDVELNPAGIERVLVVSFDGMRPDAIEAAGMTNLLNLMESSAYTLEGQTISFPVTLPSHASMLTGMCMNKHGLKWNGNNLYWGHAKGTDIFNLTHDANMKSIMLVGKEKLRLIAEPETVDDFEVFVDEAQIAEDAIRLMPSDFDLMFLHFPSADLRGHKYGWMSNAQFQALQGGDEALGKVLAALDENGMRDSTLVIVTADHGGHGDKHDGTRIEDYLIPWIVSGPGVVPHKIESSIKIMDTAATVAFALGLPLPPEWDGIPVYEAFGFPPQDVHYNGRACE